MAVEDAEMTNSKLMLLFQRVDWVGIVWER